MAISFGDQLDGANRSVSNVVLLGTNISLDYNAKTMDFTVPTDKVTAAIYMHKVSQNVDPNDNPNVLPDVYSSILVPQTILGGSAMIDVTLSNGAVYRYSAAEGGHLFEKGKAYTMSLRIGKDKVTLTSPVKVNKWSDGLSVNEGTDLVVPFGDPNFASVLIKEYSITNINGFINLNDSKTLEALKDIEALDVFDKNIYFLDGDEDMVHLKEIY